MTPWLFLLLIPAAVLLWAIGAVVLSLRQGAADCWADDVPHGDIIHVPVGATPEALRGERASHGGAQ